MAEAGGWSAGGGAVTASGGPRPSLEDVGAELLFEKVLTTCDAASRGRIVLPKKAAVEHFACQDGKIGLTVQCEDTFGNEHTIVHRFWTNAKSRMYLLEGLESVFRVYKVSSGDVLVFGLMPTGKMVMTVRLPGPDDVQRTRRSANAVGPAADKPAKAKQPSVPAVATRRQKRARLLERAASVDSESSQEGADYFQPPPDGVFRAVPPGADFPLEPQVLCHGICWSATADIGGELYQAFFDTAAGAFDAFIAAGHDLPPQLAAAAAKHEAQQQAEQQYAGDADMVAADPAPAESDADEPAADCAAGHAAEPPVEGLDAAAEQPAADRAAGAADGEAGNRLRANEAAAGHAAEGATGADSDWSPDVRGQATNEDAATATTGAGGAAAAANELAGDGMAEPDPAPAALGVASSAVTAAAEAISDAAPELADAVAPGLAPSQPVEQPAGDGRVPTAQTALEGQEPAIRGMSAIAADASAAVDGAVAVKADHAVDGNLIDRAAHATDHHTEGV